MPDNSCRTLICCTHDPYLSFVDVKKRAKKQALTMRSILRIMAFICLYFARSTVNSSSPTPAAGFGKPIAVFAMTDTLYKCYAFASVNPGDYSSMSCLSSCLLFQDFRAHSLVSLIKRTNRYPSLTKVRELGLFLRRINHYCYLARSALKEASRLKRT